jgi:hypothetical protein|mmetsp:Transcript_9423/g.17084  ORF Transcript_9423/g.17084 Transcript_9423/m.17084 type:complete len:97 (+) Transcript_9423:128-418(+)
MFGQWKLSSLFWWAILARLVERHGVRAASSDYPNMPSHIFFRQKQPIVVQQDDVAHPPFPHKTTTTVSSSRADMLLASIEKMKQTLTPFQMAEAGI